MFSLLSAQGSELGAFLPSDPTRRSRDRRERLFCEGPLPTVTAPFGAIATCRLALQEPARRKAHCRLIMPPAGHPLERATRPGFGAAALRATERTTGRRLC